MYKEDVSQLKRELDQKRRQVVKLGALKTGQRKTNPNNGGRRNGRASDLRRFGDFTFRAESLP